MREQGRRWEGVGEHARGTARYVNCVHVLLSVGRPTSVRARRSSTAVVHPTPPPAAAAAAAAGSEKVDGRFLPPRDRPVITVRRGAALLYRPPPLLPARRCVRAVLAMGVCLSVCLSVTSRCAVETAGRIELVFVCLGASFEA